MNGERLLWEWQRYRRALYTKMLSGSFEKLGPHSRLTPPLKLSGARRISIGARTFIGSGSWLQTFDDPEGVNTDIAISVGDGCGSSGGLALLAVREVVIEDRVGIGRGVYIADHTHRTSGDGPIREQGITGVAPVRICTGAWIGQNAVILPGVTIGRGAVVGANSVVREDVPPRTVAAGAPARIVKQLA